MNGFVNWLENLNVKDSKVRAILRRSLAFDPGTYVPAFPYIEPFLRDEDSAWRREMLYLVAGLWAMHWKDGMNGQAMGIGQACAAYQITSGSASTERRFINLLDADGDQLAHRLRQLVSLLNEYVLDFEALLKGLLYWNDVQKRTQNAWARDFYRNSYNETESTNQEGE